MNNDVFAEKVRNKFTEKVLGPSSLIVKASEVRSIQKVLGWILDFHSISHSLSRNIVHGCLLPLVINISL